jgi:uncharacterized protein YacL
LLNNVIRISFAILGAITGFTLTRTVLAVENLNQMSEITAVIFFIVPIFTAILFYSTGNKIIKFILDTIDRAEALIQKMTLYEITVSSLGLVIGLVVANLIAIPVNRIDIIGAPISILLNVVLGCAGIVIALGKKHEVLYDHFKEKYGVKDAKGVQQPKVIDTSVIIDGRIVDVCRSGFLEGELVVPSFVLEELRHIADSSDTLKRNRGRRGLDVLNMIQKELEFPVRIENAEIAEGAEVDTELIKLAKKLGGKVLTIDYNLNKVAIFQGVPVLNVNELANSVKPIALPGEEMVVQVIKDGKENGQGVGYLDDGTMIVVDGGKRHIGENVSVMVTSILQTSAGRMIFAKPKYTIERAI